MKRVVILMSTYNGQEYLEEQLKSLVELDNENLEIDIKIRDDGSKDNTTCILEKYSKIYSNISWYQGENKKTAYSFLELLENFKGYDYYAFCDQDDVWDKEKLKQAVIKLKDYENEPAIYFSAVNLVDKDLNFLLKKEVQINLTFETAFIINPAIGCTMVINNKLKEFIDKLNTHGEIDMHDAWIYRMAQGINAKIVYDSNSYILYRQHGTNIEGVNDYKNFFTRMSYFILRKKRKIGETSQNILDNYKQYLDKDKINSLEQLENLSKKHSIKNKLKIIKNKRFRSNSVKQNIKFYWDILFNKI